VISHNHYDHLSYQDVLHFGNGVIWFVPMGLKQWFLDCQIDESRVVEMDWWSESIFTSSSGKSVKLVATPCQHWSKRTLWNDNASLWCSWCVISPDADGLYDSESAKKFFFSGDTGYCESFKEIGRVLGPFDLSAIAIGAYEPREFLRCQHVNPEEAVAIHGDLRSRHSVGVHWGTFVLTHEAVGQPAVDLAQAAQEKGLGEGEFRTLLHGEFAEFES